MISNRLLRLGGVLLTAALLGGCTPDPVAESRPLVKIDDRQITRSEFEAAFARTLKDGQALSGVERQELARAFLGQLVDRELTLAEARRRGIAVAPAELSAALDEHRRDYPAGDFEAMLRGRGLTLEQWRAELVDSLMLDKLVAQVVGERDRVGAMEIDAYYADHRAEFDRPAQVRVRQILVTDPAEGERLLARLRQGEPFAALAARHSVAPEAAQGGDLGFFGREEMPPEFDPVFTLPVGKPSPLIKSDYGYHIFLVEEQRPATRLSRAEAEREIRQRLQVERREALYQEWLQALRSRAAVDVDWAQLEAKP